MCRMSKQTVLSSDVPGGCFGQMFALRQVKSKEETSVVSMIPEVCAGGLNSLSVLCLPDFSQEIILRRIKRTASKCRVPAL